MEDNTFLVINGKRKISTIFDFEYCTSGFEFGISSLLFITFFNSLSFSFPLQTNGNVYL